MYQIIKSSTDGFFSYPLPVEDKKDAESGKKNSAQEKAESENKTPEIEMDYMSELTLLHGNSLFEQTSKGLDELLESILNRDPTNEGLSFIFKYLEPWITSMNDWERLRAMRSLSSILKYFCNNLKNDEVRNFLLFFSFS